MLTALIAALALAAEPPVQKTPDAAPDPCAQASNCRFVDVIDLTLPSGKPMAMKIGRQMPFLIQPNGESHLGLVPGEQVVIRLGHAGEPAMVLVHAGHAPAAKVEAPPLESDTIRLTFTQMPAQPATAGKAASAPGMLLTVENGYSRALAYHAAMVTMKDVRPTDVCQVGPKLASFENWPEPFPIIDLSGFQLVDGDAAKLVCQ
jgi:hypothetical protein